MRILLTLILSSSFLCAQDVSFGVKGGWVGPEAYSGIGQRFSDESKQYTFGPSVEVQLPWGLAAEFDVLYRRIGFDRMQFDGGGSTLFNDRQRSNNWEFPLLAKYGPRSFRGARPYVLAGWSTRLVNNQDLFSLRSVPNFGNGTWNIFDSTTYRVPHVTVHGVVAGAGVEFRKARFRFTPEFRYTRWNQFFGNPTSLRFHYGSTPDQFQVLFGVSFGGKR